MTTVGPELEEFQLGPDIEFTERMAVRSMVETTALITWISLILAYALSASLQWVTVGCGLTLLVRELYRRSQLEHTANHLVIARFMSNRISFFGALSGLGLASMQVEFRLPFILACAVLASITIFLFAQRDQRTRITLLYAIQVVGTYLLVSASTSA
ncbi:MAG: hypothetical protein KBC02_00460 [Candidatus Pacebacteria bacterium]|nr:hypothetical protein [Candidatus Paceibacterota bacterium]